VQWLYNSSCRRFSNAGYSSTTARLIYLDKSCHITSNTIKIIHIIISFPNPHPEKHRFTTFTLKSTTFWYQFTTFKKSFGLSPVFSGYFLANIATISHFDQKMGVFYDR